MAVRTGQNLSLGEGVSGLSSGEFGNLLSPFCTTFLGVASSRVGGPSRNPQPNRKQPMVLETKCNRSYSAGQ